jgi:hypothetical protein
MYVPLTGDADVTTMNAGPADPKLKARFADLGSTVLSGSPAEFGKLYRGNRWGKVDPGGQYQALAGETNPIADRCPYFLLRESDTARQQGAAAR